MYIKFLIYSIKYSLIKILLVSQKCEKIRVLSNCLFSLIAIAIYDFSMVKADLGGTIVLNPFIFRLLSRLLEMSISITLD